MEETDRDARNLIDEVIETPEWIRLNGAWRRVIGEEIKRTWNTTPDARDVARSAVGRATPEREAFLEYHRQEFRTVLLRHGFTASETAELENNAVDVAEEGMEDMTVRLILDIRAATKTE